MSGLIAGKYRIVRPLGRGGMAEVFLARVEGAAGFARSVVIKRLAPTLARDPQIVAMFLDEARIAARLHHGNIAQVFDFGTDDDGYFLAMEYLDGRDVRSIVRANPEDRIPLATVVATVIEAAAGLHYAHELRDDEGQPLHIVHRDITAANIFVTSDGTVKVIDFGIARAADRTSTTLTGMVKGTVAYLSPEQASGGVVDRRSDLFQLGVVLYEVVCGVRPFDRPGDTDLVVMARILAGDFKRPGLLREDCPDDLEQLMLELLSVDPDRRPQTGEQLLTRLEAIARAHSWSTSSHELARVLRDRAPALPEADAEATTEADAAAATDDRDAVLADLEAPPRNTAKSPARAEQVTIRERTPSARSTPAPARRATRLVIPLAVGALAIVATVVIAWWRSQDRGVEVSKTDPSPISVAPKDAAQSLPEPGRTDASSPMASADAMLGVDDRLQACLKFLAERIERVQYLQQTRHPVRQVREAYLQAESQSITACPVYADLAYRASPHWDEYERKSTEFRSISERLERIERAHNLVFYEYDVKASRTTYQDSKTGRELTSDEADARFDMSKPKPIPK